MPAGAAACPGCGAPVDGNERGLPPGTQLQNGRYSVGKVLGEGGFGIAYKGVHRELKQIVAIKELFPDRATRKHLAIAVPARQASEFDRERQRALKEARAVARVASNHVVGVLDAFTENNTVYIVMEYLKGRSLREELDRRTPMPPKRVLMIALHLCSALTAVHGHNLLHRDVKPANVMLTRAGRTVLVDFGSARVFSGDRTVSHTRILSTDYAAPEMFGTRGRFGPPTDLYCLAATLYEALTGAPPPSVVDRLQGARLADDKVLHSPLGRTIVRALQVDAAARPRTAAEFMAGCLAVTAPKDKAGRKAKGKQKSKRQGKGKQKNKGRAAARPRAVPVKRIPLKRIAVPPDHVLKGPAAWARRPRNTHLEFHPYRPLLAAAGGRQGRVWDGDRKWGPVHSFEYRTRVRKLAFRDDLLAMVDKRWCVHLWDAGEHKCPGDINTAEVKMYDAAWNLAVAGALAGCTRRGRLVHWDALSGRVRKGPRPTHLGRSPHRARFTPEGTHLVGWRGRTLCVWDAVSGRRRHSLRATDEHRGGRNEGWNCFKALSFGPNMRLLTVCSDGRTRIWDLRAGLCRLLPGPHDELGWDFAYALPHGALWNAAGDTVAHVCMTGGHARHGFPNRFAGYLQSPCSPNPQPLRKLQNPMPDRWPFRIPSCGAFSPDGRSLAMGLWESDCIFLWDTATAQIKTLLRGAAGGTLGLAFNSDSSTLAAAGADGRVRLWTSLS